jgi:hypothetical protein
VTAAEEQIELRAVLNAAARQWVVVGFRHR